MFYALIGPEFVLIWAWRQRIFAGMRSETLEGVPVFVLDGRNERWV